MHRCRWSQSRGDDSSDPSQNPQSVTGDRFPVGTEPVQRPVVAGRSENGIDPPMYQPPSSFINECWENYSSERVREMPDNVDANSTAHVERVTRIFDSIEAIDADLSDLETLLRQTEVPAGVEDQLRAVDEQLFEIKHRLAEAWGDECFTRPIMDCDADCEPGTCTDRSEVVAP